MAPQEGDIECPETTGAPLPAPGHTSHHTPQPWAPAVMWADATRDWPPWPETHRRRLQVLQVWGSRARAPHGSTFRLYLRGGAG